MFNIYPNVSSGEKVIIEFFLNEPIEKAFLEVVSEHGFVLWMNALEKLQGYHRVDWTPPPSYSGVYMVRIRNKFGSKSRKLIIAR